MYLEEVMPALRAGKAVRYIDVPRNVLCLSTKQMFSEAFMTEELLSNKWYIVEDPATDTELVAALSQRADIWEAEHEYLVCYELRRAAKAVASRVIPTDWR